MNQRKKLDKLVFIIESMGIGGAERVVSILAENLCDKYEISIITFKKKQVEYPINMKIERLNFEIPEGYKKFFEGRRKLENELMELKPDVVIAFDILPNILVNAIKRRRRKWLTVISERSAPREAEISILSKILRKLYYRKADRYVFQTEEAMNFYSKSIQQRSYIISNPIREGLPKRVYNGEHKVVAVGRLTKAKNYPCLLTAFSLFIQKYKDYILEIYGEGESREEIEDIIKQLGLSPHVKLMGNCEDVHCRIRKAKLFVMTSSYEGMPNALMEAMVMGFPVIASDCPSGGPRKIIKDGENGFLFENNDYQKLFEKMCYAVEYPELEQLGKKAQEIEEQFSSQIITNKWDDLIKEVENKC